MTEFCNGGDICSYIRADKSRHHLFVGEMVTRKLIRQVCEGLLKIYNMDYMHRDLKLANIMLHFPEDKHSLNDAIIKIGDLGLAKNVPH